MHASRFWWAWWPRASPTVFRGRNADATSYTSQHQWVSTNNQQQQKRTWSSRCVSSSSWCCRAMGGWTKARNCCIRCGSDGCMEATQQPCHTPRWQGTRHSRNSGRDPESDGGVARSARKARLISGRYHTQRAKPHPLMGQQRLFLLAPPYKGHRVHWAEHQLAWSRWFVDGYGRCGRRSVAAVCQQRQAEQEAQGQARWQVCPGASRSSRSSPSRRRCSSACSRASPASSPASSARPCGLSHCTTSRRCDAPTTTRRLPAWHRRLRDAVLQPPTSISRASTRTGRACPVRPSHAGPKQHVYPVSTGAVRPQDCRNRRAWAAHRCPHTLGRCARYRTTAPHGARQPWKRA